MAENAPTIAVTLAHLRLLSIRNPPNRRLPYTRRHRYLVEFDGHSDYLPTLLRSSILRSPLLAG
jgi:hypothetical protein